MGTLHGVMVNKVDEQTIVSEFESLWGLDTFVLTPQANNYFSSNGLARLLQNVKKYSVTKNKFRQNFYLFSTPRKEVKTEDAVINISMLRVSIRKNCR